MMNGFRGFVCLGGMSGSRHALQAAGSFMSVLSSCTIGLRASGACVILNIVGNPTSFFEPVGINLYGIWLHIKTVLKNSIVKGGLLAMAQDSKKTVFTLDAEKCIGCGICVDACPLKILALTDGLCIMTEPTKCLECGTCIRECPQDAIFIPGVKVTSKTGTATARTASADPVSPDNQKFTPILQHLTDMLMRELEAVQIFEHAGTDIRSLQEFDVEGHSCFYRAYRAPKLEKIGLSRMNFYGTMVADVVIVTPGPEYDMPYYVMDWDESDEHIFFICDLMPGDDVGRNQEQLQKYYYEPLEDCYHEYAALRFILPISLPVRLRKRLKMLPRSFSARLII
jgi:NAD-dependent dihydropyrimidine dehydrogenase PreA subunit